MHLAIPLADPGITLHPGFGAAIRDEETAAIIRRYAKAQGWPAGAIAVGPATLAATLPLRPGFPRLLILDVDGEGDAAAAVADACSRLGRGAKVVALGSQNDVGLFRRLLAAGAADYLAKPLTLDTLRAAVDMPCAAALAPTQAPTGPEPGRVTLVLGARGGVGASTVAVNTAWLLAHERRRNTALLDLDLQFGTAALALDLEPGRGLREALEVPDRLDPLLLTSCMVQESERLSVLGAEETVDERIAFDPTAVLALVKELRGTFDHVVIDLPRHLIPAQRQLLGVADTVVIVSELSLPGIRDTVRLTRAVQSASSGTATPPRILTLAARVPKDRKPQVDRQTFEKGIHGALSAVVPEDVKAMALAANQGKALGAVASDSPATAALRDLAGRLAGTNVAPKPGLVARLFGRRVQGGAR